MWLAVTRASFDITVLESCNVGCFVTEKLHYVFMGRGREPHALRLAVGLDALPLQRGGDLACHEKEGGTGATFAVRGVRL